MKGFLALVKKDLRIELRTKETLALMLGLSLLMAVIVAFGANSAFFTPAQERKIFPAFVWLIFVFTATVSVGRSYDYELEHMGIEGLILSGVFPSLIYASKVVTNFLVILTGHLFAVCVLAILLNVDIVSVAVELIFLSVLVTAAYSALSTILAAMASTSRLKNMLLPLILLPLLFPIFFAALETTAHLLARQQIEYGSFWFTLLLALNVVYLVLGVNLYEYVIKE